MDYKDKNINAVHENTKMQQARIIALESKVTRLENNLASLQADVANTKQLIGHVMGRGMGSTTE